MGSDFPFHWTSDPLFDPFTWSAQQPAAGAIRDLIAGVAQVLELIERDRLAEADEGYRPLLSPGQHADLMRLAIVAARTAAGHAESLLAGVGRHLGAIRTPKGP